MCGLKLDIVQNTCIITTVIVIGDGTDTLIEERSRGKGGEVSSLFNSVLLLPRFPQPAYYHWISSTAPSSALYMDH
jgi:hypothetical protein